MALRKIALNPALHIIALAACVWALYGGAIDAPFQWDDVKMVADNPIVQDMSFFSTPSKAIGQTYFLSLKRRYLGFLTFALNYRMGEEETRGYHAVNIMVHLLTSLMVYLLARALLRTPRLAPYGAEETRAILPMIAALLFACHPLATEAVTYIFQRLASMMTLFYLTAIVMYLHYRLSGNRIYMALAVVSSLTAMLIKENAFTAPLMAAAIEFIFFGADKFKQRLRGLAPLLLTLLLIPLMEMFFIQSGSAAGLITGAANAVDGSSPLEYFLTQIRVLPTYMRLMLLPINQNLDCDYPMYAATGAAATALAGLLSALMIAGGVHCLKRAASNGLLALPSFIVAGFFLPLAVESSIIPIPMVMNEYRTYLPLAFVAPGAVLWAGLSIKASRMRAIMLVAMLACLALLAHQRNGLWSSELALWSDTASKSPLKARPNYNAAKHYAAAGDLNTAAALYERAIAINPDYVEALNNLANIYKNAGRLERAVELFERAVVLRPRDYRTHNNLGSAYASVGNLEKAATHYNDALTLKPDYPEAHNNLGNLYRRQDRLNDAVTHFRKALALLPGHPVITKNLNDTLRELLTSALSNQPEPGPKPRGK